MVTEKEIDWAALSNELKKGNDTVSVEVDRSVYAEFEYLSMLLKGDSELLETPTDIINVILTAFADGSRRPGSWERDMLDSVGLISNRPEHQVYRQEYGEPKTTN